MKFINQRGTNLRKRKIWEATIIYTGEDLSDQETEAQCSSITNDCKIYVELVEPAITACFFLRSELSVSSEILR